MLRNLLLFNANATPAIATMIVPAPAAKPIIVPVESDVVLCEELIEGLVLGPSTCCSTISVGPATVCTPVPVVAAADVIVVVVVSGGMTNNVVVVVVLVVLVLVDLVGFF